MTKNDNYMMSDTQFQDRLNWPIPKKRFGQNFLQDSAIIAQIIQAIAPQSSDHLVEVGPGQGALTQHLVGCSNTLHVIEIDRNLSKLLQSKWGEYSEFKLIEHDVLKMDWTALTTNDHSLRVIGNLPYNISTPLLFKLIQARSLIKDMHFMLQKEVVDRLVAQPGTKQYGRLTVMMQYFCRIEKLFDVPPYAFKPAPKVNSAVVRLIPYKTLPVICHDLSQLSDIVRHGFTLRRKTLKNSLALFVSEDQLKQLKIDPVRRPETLTISEWVHISNSLNH